MSIGFQFTALVKQQKPVLETIKGLSQKFGYNFFSGDDWARVEFCRMGDMNFNFETKKQGLFAKTELTCDTCTSLVGAGFHASAIDFVDALVKAENLKITMEDETDYYSHRNFEEMRERHFYQWLKILVENCLDKDKEEHDLCFCWDMNQYLPEGVLGSVVTPLGRFNIKAIVDLVKRGEIESFAKEFFIWNERERDGRFYRNSAMAVLWEDCYFQPSGRSELDNIANETAINLLEQAVKLDKSLPMPKAEYILLCELHGHSPIDMSASPDLQAQYLIGYRRGIVSYRIGNTNVAIDGSFIMEEQDSTIWYDAKPENWHNIRVSAFAIKEGQAEFSPQLFDGTAEPMEEFDVGDGKGRAAFAGERQEDDECYYQSIAQIICNQQTTLITASYQNIEEKAWAMNLFKKIKAHD